MFKDLGKRLRDATVTLAAASGLAEVDNDGKSLTGDGDEALRPRLL